MWVVSVVACLLAISFFAAIFNILNSDAREGGGQTLHSEHSPVRVSPGPFDLSEVDAPPPNSAEGGNAASRAALRATASACNASFFDGVLVQPPLKECYAAEISAAVTAGSRSGLGEWHLHRGAPLVVPGCRLEWFSGPRLCDLLKDVGGLDMNGDSLIRHLTTTIVSLAIGDVDRGLNRHMGNESWRCECDWAYDDGHRHRFEGNYDSTGNRQCRIQALAITDLPSIRKAWPNYCPSWGDTNYIPHLGWPPPGESRARVMVINGGLHGSGLSRENAEQFFFRKPGPARHYIYCLQWAPGANKPTQFVENFGEDATQRYNAIIRERAANHSALVLDTYRVTFNTPSIDGQHYYQAANVDLAQVLLNMIAALRREDLQVVAAADNAGIAAGIAT